MKTPTPVNCGDCGREWPRDPALEVACPVCKVAVGRPCTVARPSQHVHSAAFAGLPAWGHDERELLAAAENKYGCGCGVTPSEARRRLDCLRAGVPYRRSAKAVEADELPLFAGVL